MAVATPKITDIRTTLPLAIKTGTTNKPVWLIDGQAHRFVKPVNKKGLDAENKHVRLGKRLLAKYKAGVTKTGADLIFVGLFSRVDN